MRLSGRISGLLLAGLAFFLVSCGETPAGTQHLQSGQSQGYVAGDGSILELPADKRKITPVFSGPTVSGSKYSSEEHRGKVQVVNFWYAACAPCRVEAPILEELAREYGDSVQFVGVNVRDTKVVAQTFIRDFHISFPSILDAQTSAVKLAFSGQIPPNATPVTYVLDAQGRIASRILGEIGAKSTLEDLIKSAQGKPGVAA